MRETGQTVGRATVTKFQSIGRELFEGRFSDRPYWGMSDGSARGSDRHLIKAGDDRDLRLRQANAMSASWKFIIPSVCSTRLSIGSYIRSVSCRIRDGGSGQFVAESLEHSRNPFRLASLVQATHRSTQSLATTQSE